MSKTGKVWLMIASILVVLGLAIFAGVMFAYDWDFSKLSTVSYETNTYEISETFDSMSIYVDTTEITFALTDEEACRIVCHESEKVTHSPTVQNGVLIIRTVDTRKWIDYIGIFYESPQMTVYLPKDKYVDLLIETDTGDVRIPKDLSFATLKIESDTADVDCLASVSEAVKVETDTGNIRLDGITAGKVTLSTETGNITLHSTTVNGNVEAETDTGEVKLTDVLCSDLQVTSNTGNVDLRNVVASGRFSIKTDTGDVRFDSSDAKEIVVETDTGDVKGSLLTDKVFIAKSDRGRIDVPKTTIGGMCAITTETGDIRIEIKYSKGAA